MIKFVFGAVLLSLALTACSSTAKGHSPAARATGAHTLDVNAPGGTPVQAATPTSSTASAPAIPDACTLITRTEAEKILGIKLQPGADTRAGAADGVASCNYNAPVTGPSGSLGVFAQTGTPDALTTDRNLGHRFRTVAGIGDQTLEEPDNGSIFVRKGALWVFIDVPISTPSSALLAAARIANARLG